MAWLLGPLSDKFGCRPVMLFGILFFAAACLLTNWVSSIEKFVSLCFIQEAFDEALAVRMMALMANVALLTGPLAGAAWPTVGTWRSMFWLFAACSLLAFVVLWRVVMPKTASDRSHSTTLPNLAPQLRPINERSAGDVWLVRHWTGVYPDPHLGGAVDGDPDA